MTDRPRAPRRRRRASRLGRALLPLLVALAGCDLDWQAEANRAFEKALEADEDGRYEDARAWYEKALAVHPYHPAANRNLAALLEVRFFDEYLAIRYYERYLDLEVGDRRETGRIRQAMAHLENIRSGRWEDPVDAAEDLLWAVRRASGREFRFRLDEALTTSLAERNLDPEAYLARWNERTEGAACRLLYRDIMRGRGGMRALVTLRIDRKGTAPERRQLLFALNEDGLWLLRRDKKEERP